MYPEGHTPADEDGAEYPNDRRFQDAQVTTLSPKDFAALWGLPTLPNAPLRRACQMEAYFNTMKDSPFGGPKVASLVCTCPRCSGRVSL